MNKNFKIFNFEIFWNFLKFHEKSAYYYIQIEIFENFCSKIQKVKIWEFLKKIFKKFQKVHFLKKSENFSQKCKKFTLLKYLLSELGSNGVFDQKVHILHFFNFFEIFEKKF